MNRSIREAVQKAALHFSPLTGNIQQAWVEAEALMAHTWTKDHAWTLAHGEIALTPAKQSIFDALVRRRLRHEPMAYLVGSVEFCGRRFRTDARALIPRPETEELVGHVLKHFTNALLLDIGTGCGAIALTIKAERPNIEAMASDASAEAISLARANARALRISGIHFFRADLLDAHLRSSLSRSRATHLYVTANLPYLPLSDKKTLPPEVKRYEPASALFAKRDGLDLNLKLLAQLAAFQRTDRRPLSLFAEFDPPQSIALEREAMRLFPHAKIHILKDTCGRDRILRVIAPTPQTSDRPSSLRSTSALD